MKYLLLLLLAGVTFGAGAEGEKEVIPYYTIRQRVKDASIPADQSVVWFAVNGDALPLKPLTLQWSVDGDIRSQELNKRTFDVMLPKGTHIFQFFLTENHAEIYTEEIVFEGGERTDIDLYFTSQKIRVVAEKPVIYLYPEQAQNVSILVEPEGKLLFTYPTYMNGWDITANANGTLTHNGKTYPYLFWDAELSVHSETFDCNSGYILEKERIVPFLEEQLTAMGLNATEQTDFITYWGPRMAGSERVFLQFAWGEQTDQFARLQISPQPDHVNRLYITWSSLDAIPDLPLDPKPQQLPVFDRSGFDVLEWGGMEIPFGVVSITFFANK